MLGFLQRNCSNSPQKFKADLYLIYIKLILEYAVPVRAPHTRCLINKLESIVTPRYLAELTGASCVLCKK